MSSQEMLSFLSMSIEAQREKMEQEFAELQRQEDRRAIDFTTSLRNRPKNRYIDILANEATIYPRPPEPSCESVGSTHYINGNLIDLGLPHTFIACQAPVPECIPDFLSVLYENKINLIIMTTRLNEGGLVKADRYWPEEEEELPLKLPGAGGLVLSRDPECPMVEDSNLQIIRRHFILQKPNEPPHKITHVQYVGWPDHGIPQSSGSLEELLQVIKNSPTTSPILVHCSAGIGRTGTLIGAYGALTHLKCGTLNDKTVYDLVSAMKRARFGMVQRVEQYIVIYMVCMSKLGVDIKGMSDLVNQRAKAAAAEAMAAARFRRGGYR